MTESQRILSPSCIPIPPFGLFLPGNPKRQKIITPASLQVKRWRAFAGSLMAERGVFLSGLIN